MKNLMTLIFCLCLSLNLLTQVVLADTPNIQASPEEHSKEKPTLTAEAGEIEALLDASDDITRGSSSHSKLTMKVKTDRYERMMKLEVWTQGTEKSLIRVLSPKRERGISTLKVGDEAWNYLPKIDRTLKISTSAMGSAWMGSHLTNDDLIRGNRMRESYTWSLKARPDAAGQGDYIIHLTAKEDAPVVWGYVHLKINAQRIPLLIEYYNERGVLMRSLSFHDLKKIKERTVPLRMRVTPAKKQGEFTEMIYDSLDFDVTIPSRTFSLQALKQ